MAFNITNMLIVKLVADQRSIQLDTAQLAIAGILSGPLGIALPLLAAQRSTPAIVTAEPRRLTKVPNVVDMTSADAIKAIEKNKLTVVSESVNHETIAKDKVISQEPDPDVNVPVNSVVKICVSLGQAKAAQGKGGGANP